MFNTCSLPMEKLIITHTYTHTENKIVEQNQEMYYKNVEQIQEVYVEQNQVDMSNKMRFPI